MARPVPSRQDYDLALYASCVAGAISPAELERMLDESGFKDVRIRRKDGSGEFISEWVPEQKTEDLIASATIEATKPVQ